MSFRPHLGESGVHLQPEVVVVVVVVVVLVVVVVGGVCWPEVTWRMPASTVWPEEAAP